jgi:triacylglycerol lipase
LGGEIHAGFVKAADSVFLDIVCVLNEFCDKGQSVWFTGHSLGGALATLTTARLIANGITVNGLYTFGQPRVGDEGFAYHFNSNFSPYFRIVNDGDVVSRVPTSQMGFSHAGDFYYLTAEGALTQDKSYWEQFWQNKGRVLDDFLELAVFGLPEHSTNSYIEKLAGVLAQCQG